MVRIIRSPARLYRSPDIKSRKKKRSRVFDVIPIHDPEKKERELSFLDQRWEMQFFELKKFKKKHGHCDVSHTYKNKQYHSLAEWCTAQRKAKKFKPLKYSPDREKKLTELGFSWNLYEKWFESKFQQLKLYHKKHGHCNVRWAENSVLTNWCTKLKHRRIKKVSTLTEEMITRLDELGFPWHNTRKEINELLWEEQFDQLKKYKEKFGHCDVSSKKDKKYYTLGRWCIIQRKERKQDPKKYPLNRLKRLNMIGFCWDIKDKRFEEKFQQLKKYVEKYGHCNISSTTPKDKLHSLASWCQTQRTVRNRNPDNYPLDRLNKLNEIGFSWSVLDERFEYLFNELKKYQEKQGHCNVTVSKNKTLAIWCAYIRRTRKKKESIMLNEERIKRLTELGFEWSDTIKRKHELKWEELFIELQQYKEKYGHCNLPRIHDRQHPLHNLSIWVIQQRKNYQDKRKSLTPERIKKLNSIGFNWINPIKMGDSRRIKKDDLIKELQRLYTELGKPPGSEYIRKHGKYTPKPYYREFGTIANAHQAAGILCS